MNLIVHIIDTDTDQTVFIGAPRKQRDYIRIDASQGEPTTASISVTDMSTNLQETK